MMLCTPYRCAQERKNIRRQLCNWSGKALGLVGLEEVLVAAYGKSSRDKLILTEASSVLSKAVDSIENDSNTCGVCGKPKKAPQRKISHQLKAYPTSSEIIDLSALNRPAQAVGVDQPIDLSKSSSKRYASPTTPNELPAFASATASSLLRSPNGILSPLKAASAKRQRVGNLPMQRDMFQMSDNLDPSSIVQIASSLVNNWSKVQPQHHRSHSPTASPNANDFSNQYDIPGPSNTAAVHSGLAAHRPHHHNRTSAAATAGSLQRTANAGINAGVSGAQFTAEPSDISGSTLSEQDAVNRFKQWRVASWVQEASRHQREGSAVGHHEDPVQDLHIDPQQSRLPASRNNNNTNLTPSRSSPPPPLTNVPRNVPAAVNDSGKSALRKRLQPSSSSTPQPQQQHSLKVSPQPVPASNLSSQKPATGSGHEASSSSKKVRSDQQQQQQSSNNAPNLANNTASLNNLASVLSSLFPSSSTPAAPSQSAASLLPGGVSPNDLDALLTLALQNWGGSSQTNAGSTSAAASAAAASDHTAALLTAAYQQQMQQAALLQLQYASIFSNPLMYSNLLLGSGAGTSVGTASANNPLASLTNALGGSSSSASADAVLAEALLAMLGGSGSSTTHTAAVNASAAAATSSTVATSNKRTAEGAHHLHSSSHRHGGTAAGNVASSSLNVSSSSTPQRHSSSANNKASTKLHDRSTPVTAHKNSLPEKKEKTVIAVASSSENKRPKSDSPLPPDVAKIGAKSNGKIDVADDVEDLSVRPSSTTKLQVEETEPLKNGTASHESEAEVQNGEMVKEECDDKELEESVALVVATKPVVSNGNGKLEENGLNGKLSPDESSIGQYNHHHHEGEHDQQDSRDSHSRSTGHLEEDTSRSPMPRTGGKPATEIIDFQAV